MKFLATSVYLVLSLSLQASSAPLGGGEVATRDVPRELPAAQSELTLENELREKAEGHGPIKTAPSGGVVSAPAAQSSDESAPTEGGKVDAEEDDKGIDQTKAVDRSSVENQSSKAFLPENEEANDSQGSQKEASDDTSVNEESLSDEDMSEEEEILRTIVMTLRDNPQLIKALIDSETEEMQDDFYKQKARVSNPDDSGEYWGSFQRPSPQVQQMPKQIEKKAGKDVFDIAEVPRQEPTLSLSAPDSQAQVRVNPIEQKFMDDGEIKDGSPKPEAKIAVEQNRAPQIPIQKEPNPLNVLRPLKIVLPPSDFKESKETNRQNVRPETDGQQSRESKVTGDSGDERADLAAGAGPRQPGAAGTIELRPSGVHHPDKHITDSHQPADRIHQRPHQQTAEQTEGRVQHTAAKEHTDRDENELLALSGTSHTENRGPARPHM